MNLPSRLPPSRHSISLNRSINPFPAGEAVSPILRRALEPKYRAALDRSLVWSLKLLSSSNTTQSNSPCHFSFNHDRQDREIT